MKRKLPTSFWSVVLALITVIAITERVSIYLDARSLMIDEANLAFNFVDRSYGELFETLDHAQYAPPLFSVLQKAAIDVLGVHELALRLWPLLAGILTILTLIWTGRKLVALPYVIWITALVGFSWYFLRYGTEIKQYASDSWLAILAVGVALHWPWQRMTATRWAVLGVGGAIVIWASMPIVFVLSGIGLYYLWDGWKSSRSLTTFVPLASIALLWLGSFSGYYFTILATDIGSEYLQDYHAPFFFNPFITSIEGAKSQYYLFQNLLATALPKYIPVLATMVALGIYGAIALYRQHINRFILLLVPILVTIAASMLHLYTLIPRVSLFIVPFFLLFIAYGAQQLISKANNPIKIVLSSYLIIVVVLQMNITYLWQPMHIDPLKPAISYIKKTDASLPVIIHYEAVPSYRFYIDYYANPATYRLSKATLTEWDAFAPAVTEKLQKNSPFWLLIVHTPPEKVKQLLTLCPPPTHSFTLGRSYAYRIQP